MACLECRTSVMKVETPDQLQRELKSLLIISQSGINVVTHMANKSTEDVVIDMHTAEATIKAIQLTCFHHVHFKLHGTGNRLCKILKWKLRVFGLIPVSMEWWNHWGGGQVRHSFLSLKFRLDKNKWFFKKQINLNHFNFKNQCFNLHCQNMILTFKLIWFHWLIDFNQISHAEISDRAVARMKRGREPCMLWPHYTEKQNICIH